MQAHHSRENFVSAAAVVVVVVGSFVLLVADCNIGQPAAVLCCGVVVAVVAAVPVGKHYTVVDRRVAVVTPEKGLV